ncbi:unnamed protein product [Pieris macdunnoughi]|uniref:Uncharacterized protein n=1 Tax=Pieris macdunnoughi TaxID=345717 RepID=A0A821X4F3_9NEOP|nr:unnamed protein product [Pieris macdunnoughi]
MAPCGALWVPPCISDMETLMETRECRAGPLTAAIQPLRVSSSPQTHQHYTLTSTPTLPRSPSSSRLTRDAVTGYFYIIHARTTMRESLIKRTQHERRAPVNFTS